MKKDAAAVRLLLQQRADVNAAQPDGATALHWAVHWDDQETVDLLIQAGANVNASNEYGATPLFLAASKGSSAMVEKLQRAGANPNAALLSGETALMTALHTGSVDSVKSLLAHSASIEAKEERGGQTALMWAAAEKRSQLVRVLIEHGADVRARSKGGFTPLLFAAQQGDLESARMLLAAGADVNEAAPNGMSALLIASASGHEAISVFLLDKGADGNASDPRGFSVLDYASSGKDMLEVVKSLLAHGVNPNQRLTRNPPNRGEGAVDMVGATPLWLAAAAGNAEVVRLLAANGADPRIPTKEGATPLMVAAGLGLFEDRRSDLVDEWYRGHLETARVLVDLGVDVNATGENGWTAMHGAAYMGSNAVIELLVRKGAKIDVKDNFGQTPLSIAEGVITVGLGDDAVHRPRNVRRSTSDLLLKLGATPLAASGVQIVVTKQVR